MDFSSAIYFINDYIKFCLMKIKSHLISKLAMSYVNLLSCVCLLLLKMNKVKIIVAILCLCYFIFNQNYD